MAGRIVLINPARHFIANAHGLGYLIPLGLVSIGYFIADTPHNDGRVITIALNHALNVLLPPIIEI